ncbi:MAG: hypothetical protein KAQ64_04350 [Candidatus Pacebacteria bacterium]|nr:hypothetical protein [Candidatus Paceibacterota bacterium]
MENDNTEQNNDQGQKHFEKEQPSCDRQNKGFNFGNLFLGLIILSVGIFYLCRNYGWLPENLNLEILRLWPVLIIAVGLSLLSSKGFLSKTIGFVIFLIVITITSFIIFYGVKNDTKPILSENPFRIERSEKTNYSSIVIKSGVGKVNITGGSEELAEGNLRSNISNLKIDNDTSSEKQKLSLEVESRDRIESLSKIENDLTVKLSSELPTDISLNLGVADTRLDLREVLVNDLDIEIGVASLDLIMGDRAEIARVNLRSGVSSVKISLPDNVGSRIIIKEGLSSKQLKDLEKIDDKTYQTVNYDEAEKKIEIDLDIGLSRLEIKHDIQKH